jgi:hypothetical protein
VFAFDYYFVALQEPQVYKTRIITSEFQNTQRKDHKLRDKRSRAKAKAATEQLTSDLVTVASAAGMGYFMGRQVVQADPSKENYLEEATQLMGIDYDLAISGAAAAIGLTNMAGGMSDFMRSVGIGGLSAYAGRRAFFGAIEANEDESKASLTDQRFPSVNQRSSSRGILGQIPNQSTEPPLRGR